MSEPSLRRAGGLGSGALGRQPDSLADVLERVLDKGIVIAGDVVVNILDIELLTLKLRLFISSAETAREMGLDWWSHDPFFSGRPAVEQGDDENQALRDRVAQLEELVRNAGLDGEASPRALDQDGQRS
jgi:Gas vesicle protein